MVNQDLDLKDDEWVTDSKPVNDGSRVGAADIFIPSRACVIQIDGSSHFVHKYKVDKCKQRLIDDRFNIAALKKFHVIRLHENDVHTLRDCLSSLMSRQVEMSEMHENIDHHVLHYSETYYNDGLVDEYERDELECSQYND